MDCALVRNHLDAYVDGELEPSPAATLETHLHACPVCRDELSVSRSLKRAVHALPRPELPESLRVEVIRALDQAERGDGVSRRGVAFTAGLAVVAAALLAVVATQRPEAPPIDPTPVAMTGPHGSGSRSGRLWRERYDEGPDPAPYGPAAGRHPAQPRQACELAQQHAWLPSGRSRFHRRCAPRRSGSINVDSTAALLNYTVAAADSVMVFQPPAETRLLPRTTPRLRAGLRPRVSARTRSPTAMIAGTRCDD